MRLSTKLIHAGEPHPRIEGAVAMPIFQSSTFEFSGGPGTSYHDVRYIRLNNTPNHVALSQKLSALEETEDALVTASGMAAVSAALMSLLRTGDHVLANDCLYGGTVSLFDDDLAAVGIGTSYVDGNDPSSWKQHLRPSTKVFYVEAITNPLMQVIDLDAVVEFAKAHSLVTIIDATMATPINFRPATRGFDLVVHSATKYLNGHSDLVAGVVAGKRDLVARAKKKLDHLGGTLDPHTCFLLHRGLKTLGVRMRHQNESSLRIARFLAAHPGVAAVNHPWLESSAGYARARALFTGGGGMLSFRPKGGARAADAFTRGVRLAISAPSLGGPETLVTRPTTTSHAGLPAAQREKLGITDDLVRVSIGLEDPEDLEADFAQALA
jgi:cystathionine beta-lyase/cystathionine gamma-synthase